MEYTGTPCTTGNIDRNRMPWGDSASSTDGAAPVLPGGTCSHDVMAAMMLQVTCA